MNIKEILDIAAETEQPFKRADWTHWLTVNKFGHFVWTLDGVEEYVALKEAYHFVADDWELR